MDNTLNAQGPPFWKVGVFIGSSLLVVAVFAFTHQMIQRLSREVETTSHVLARFCAQASLPATRDTTLQRIFGEVIGGIDFPIVVTDDTGLPRAWRHVEPDPSLVSAAALDSVAAGMNVSPATTARIARVKNRVRELDRRNAPIEMEQPGSGTRLGAVHYGQPVVLDQLRWMPYVSVAGVLLLLSIGLWGLAGIQQAEKRTIWVGMAKETAHQLGTPLSSLLGWVELLRDHAGGAPPGGEVRIPAAEFEETLGEMTRDVDRLNKVAQRFSHIGSTPMLQIQDVTPVVRDAVQYMRKRVPQSNRSVEIFERYEEVPLVSLNRELIEWVLENLLSNSINALERPHGRIEIAVGRNPDAGTVEIHIADNGRGMAPFEQKKAFEPGYTTKSRGWGLGLALARRVIEDYHGGKIFVRESEPGEGTTMVISLPV